MSVDLRRAQNNIFAPGPSAATRPQAPAPKARGPFVHLCQAPGCGEWGTYGIGIFGNGTGAWFCAAHRSVT